MPAKDYELVIAMETAYLAKVSKSQPGLMLTDRKAIPDSTMFHVIEHFARARLKEGHNTLDIDVVDDLGIKHRTAYSISFNSPEQDERRKKRNNLAKMILEATDGMTDEEIIRMPGIPLTLVSLAKMVVELTS